MTRVNPEILEELSPTTRSDDVKFQRVQNATVQAVVAITQATDNTVAASKSNEVFTKIKMAATITALVDGLALIANANQELNQRRREGRKADPKVAYEGLCNNDTGMYSLFYGDDLSTRIKDINETKMIASKLTARSSLAQRPSTRSRFGQRQHPYSMRGKTCWRFR